MKEFLKNLVYIIIIASMLGLSGCGAPSGSPSSGGGSDGGGNSLSQSGSTAAMLIHKNALYILDSFQLNIFELEDDGSPVLLSETYIAFAETLFIYDEHLFIGGESGVDIWDISEPLNPSHASFYQHVRGCDPIIVEDDIGYITLRSRPGCRGDVNRLEVVDFSDTTAPVHLHNYDMPSPYGLAKTDEYIAICQEEYGLTFLDVQIGDEMESRSVMVDEVAQYNEINCFDLIYTDDRLIFTATDGIYQMAVDGYWLTQLSKIPVGTSGDG